MRLNDKILIVDDEHRMCDSLKTLLCSQGYEIKTCGSGRDALACMATDTFDLILLDFVMAEMNGFQVMERMALWHLDIPVIIMTANPSTASPVEALRLGACDYLKKPFETEELLTSVRIALEQEKLKKENHRVMKKLRDSEERFRRLAENAKDMIYRMSLPDGHYEYVSPASVDLFGYTPEEFYESPALIRKVMHPKWGDYFEEQWKNLLSGNMPPVYEYQILHKSGEERWLHQRNVLIRDDNGQPKAIEAVVSDITERKRFEVVLRVCKNKYKNLVENISDVIYEIDDQGKITYVSPVGLKIWESDPREIIDRHFIELVHPEDRERLINRFSQLRQGLEHPVIFRFVNKSGRIIWVRSRTTPVMEKGVFKGARGILSDITALKLAEEERLTLEKRLQQAQKAESLGRMAGAIAHHFNNQLAVVMGNLELSIEDSARGKVPLENLTQALKGARKAAEVSGLMLAYLGQTTAKKEPMDICKACNRSLPLHRAVLPKRILLEANLTFPGPAINGNANQIQQILANLIANAQEAIGDGLGAIELTVKTVSAAEIPAAVCFPIGWQPQSEIYACLEVADSGCGIEEKNMEKLFDPFYTTKFVGRGLGLAVVLGILKAHCGTIMMESEPGRGSIFRIYLPVSTEEAARPPATAAKAPEMGGGELVLLAEDEDQVRKMAGAMLRHLGFTVLEAKDGLEAVEVFRRQKDEIRCVLCDLTMPGQDGWETLSALRKLDPGIPVIITSGHDLNQVMTDDHPDQPQAFLQKPFSLKELEGKVMEALAQK